MNNITLCVMSCGEITEKTCFWALQSFLLNGCTLETVSKVTPQIRALNAMIYKCNTTWLIPVDADMVLYEDSYLRIKNAINKYRHRDDWHSILFPLWDTLTQRKILALKILRTEIIKKHPFMESATPDVEHYQRLTDLGYVCIEDYLKQRPIGNHVVTGHHFCYHKYRDVYQTYRSHNCDWDSAVFLGGHDLLSRAKAHYDFFITQWIKTENPDYLSCIAGMMDGILSPLEHKSKDLSQTNYRFEGDKWVTAIFYDWYMKNHPKINRINPILM